MLELKLFSILLFKLWMYGWTVEMGAGGKSIGKGFGKSSKMTRKHENLSNESKTNKESLYKKVIEPLIKAGHIQKAEPALKLLAQARVQIPQVYRDLARIAEQNQMPLEAKKWYYLWLNTETNQEDLLWEQAKAAEELNAHELLPMYYKKLVKLSPDNPEVLERCAIVSMKEEAFHRAIFLLQRLQEKMANSVKGLLYEAVCQIEIGEYKKSSLLMKDLKKLKNLKSCNESLKAIYAAVQARIEYNNSNHTKTLIDIISIENNHSLLWPINRLLIPIVIANREYSRAEKLVNAALEIQQNSKYIHLANAELQLLQQNWKIGFSEYDWRFYSPKDKVTESLKIDDYVHASQRKSPLTIVADSSLGDTLLFSRYVALASQRLERSLTFYVQPPLINILKINLPTCIQIKDNSNYVQQKSVESISLLSMPNMMGSWDEVASLNVPHLRTNSDVQEKWRKLIDLKFGELLIGLNWHGSALNSASEEYSSDFPLESLKPFSQLPNVRLISFQKGMGSEQLKKCTFSDAFVSCQNQIDELYDFAEIAAIMQSCSVVITDDSGPAHLCGNLGVNCFVLLAQKSNWRWPDNSNRVLWYPQTTLFRKDGNKDWDYIIKDACEAIQSRRDTPPAEFITSN